MILVIFGRFLIIFYIFDPRILKSYSKDIFFFNDKFWKPIFGLQTPLFLPNFHHPWVVTAGHKSVTNVTPISDH